MGKSDVLTYITYLLYYMRFLVLMYYPAGTAGPVRDYFDSLSRDRPEAFLRLAQDLEVLGAEGLASKRIRMRSLGGGLWELKRRYGGVHYRIFLCAAEGRAWLLHAIEKKSAKTPVDDLQLAKRRMRSL